MAFKIQHGVRANNGLVYRMSDITGKLTGIGAPVITYSTCAAYSMESSALPLLAIRETQEGLRLGPTYLETTGGV